MELATLRMWKISILIFRYLSVPWSLVISLLEIIQYRLWLLNDFCTEQDSKILQDL